VKVSRYVLAAAALALFAIPASADVDTLTIYDGGGNIVSQVSVDDATADPNVIYYDVNSAAFIDPDQFGNPTNLFTGDPNEPTVTDIFGIASTDDGLQLAFNTGAGNPEGPAPFGGVGDIYIPDGQENGTSTFDATMYLDPALQREGFTASFSETPSAPSIPEPASLTLLSLGAMGLGIRAWQKRRKMLLQLA
jgi:PEP-CTERM motif